MKFELLEIMVSVMCVNVILSQEPKVKLYTETSSSPVYAYLGIPFVAPPVGMKRFAPPERHSGWNQTLIAAKMGPQCPHLTESSSGHLGSGQSENCLYLNVWTPVASDSYGNIPVLVYFDGENFAFPNPQPIPGQDLATEGVVVVTANYRLNVFGFFCLGVDTARGNLGLLDQYFALLWIRENISKFGGNPRSVTLMGHSSGAASVLYHMISPRTKDLFSRAIIMSGFGLSPWSMTKSSTSPRNASLAIASSLGCPISRFHLTIQCLREKSTEDILRAFDKQFQNGYWLNLVLPVVDTFLPVAEQYLPYEPIQAFKEGHVLQIPVMMGLTDTEAVERHWIDMSKQGHLQLLHHIEQIVMPNIIQHYGFENSNLDIIKELIKWNYFGQVKTGNASALLEQLQRLYSDARYEAPFAKQLQLMISAINEPIYVYKFVYPGGINLNGRNFNSSGAPHGSELPFIFGPTLLQQLSRRRMTESEKRFSKFIKSLWANFIRIGNPTSLRQYNTWLPYKENNFVQVIGVESRRREIRYSSDVMNKYASSLWNDLLPHIFKLGLEGDKKKVNDHLQLSTDTSTVYRHAAYTLTGLVIALLTLLLVCIILLKQRAKDRQRDAGF